MSVVAANKSVDLLNSKTFNTNMNQKIFHFRMRHLTATLNHTMYTSKLCLLVQVHFRYFSLSVRKPK